MLFSDMTDHELSEAEIQAGLAKVRELAALAVDMPGHGAGRRSNRSRPRVCAR